jgi:hypothetical protein
MAIIRKLSGETHSVKPHKTAVDATYQVILDANGNHLFHLSTYGSDDRASLPKVSQTFQVDEEMASALVSALYSAFGNAILANIEQ